MTTESEEVEELGLSSKIVSLFLQGPLPIILIIGTLMAGVVALWLTPREEEPQIVVPLADVLVSAPGLSAEQVERQVATPLEKLLSQIDGVEYVYSMSREGAAIVTVRFYVGQDRTASLVKIYNKINSNVDQVPPYVKAWVVKPIEIDDVPIVIATLWSDDPRRADDHELRRIAEELVTDLQSVPNTNRITVVGGRPRAVRVELMPDALAARRTSPLDVAWALGVHNVQLPAGGIDQADRAIVVEGGSFIAGVRDLENLVVNVVDGIPVYLKDVARVIDGPDEARTYTWIGFGPASDNKSAHFLPAVSIAIAKQKGTNAVWVARDVERRLERAASGLVPPNVHYTITRDYGETANEKVNDLVEGLGVAILTVVIFVGLVLGWRAALVIALAVPVCYGATLLINLISGYTINRVTLFALILALGLLVDDPITDVENIERFYRMRKWSPRRAILLAVQEIRPALILATIAVIISFIPMFFITGMMGPYMRPMALNVPITIGMSLIVAFCVTPFLARVILKRDGHGGHVEYDVKRTALYRIYNALLGPMLRNRAYAWLFLIVIGLMFIAAVALPAFRLVPLKMLPFDNKNEFQIVVDMDEGTTLEMTEAATRALAEYLRTVPEVVDFTGFIGTASPMDFNGMVRHYYMRSGGNVADLRVSLVGKKQRAQQSHEIILRIRRDLEKIAEPLGAKIKLVEVPPGPPVIATVTAEIYGDPQTPYKTLQKAALATAARLKEEPLVRDVDSSVEADQEKLLFETDKEKAALSGVGTEDVAQTLALAIDGQQATTLNLPTEAQPLPIVLRLPRPLRSDPNSLASLYIKGRAGITKTRVGTQLKDAPQPMVPLGEIGRFKSGKVDQTIYHKNLRRVAYVFAETAGRAPADVVLDVGADRVSDQSRRDGRLQPATLVAGKDHGQKASPGGTIESSEIPLENRNYIRPGGGIPWTLPAGTSINWLGEGEWKITVDAFRDLGLAFGAAVIGIYLILWLQTGSALIAAIMILAIPLTMIGIMPGFWLLGLFGERVVAGFPNPIFFTATAMIGMIALAGIVVRNSVILVDFIHRGLKRGLTLEESLIQSGAIRTRPIILTAGTALLGNIVITLDPIFSGLAWSIIFGVAASTIFTLGVIPVVYYLVYANKPGHGASENEDVDEVD
ncbi:efflux RND transporter permease subunit [bacterium]|nr:efflux RND transporter permease subunit [bacterium]